MIWLILEVRAKTLVFFLGNGVSRKFAFEIFKPLVFVKKNRNFFFVLWCNLKAETELCCGKLNNLFSSLQAPVKFWILKSYLSPTLKDFLPYYAEKYGFEYEYVQYKWPRWLNQQTEKQRIIWGYKILFLDVMFPLDVKKIIFVDTDQIVRADLTELRDMDLKGAPYG